MILKHFPQYKTKFTRYAKAKTIAPDEWKVLMSQRRRWINSTIHNLVELLQIDRMCGFCCFSMRFVILVGASSCVHYLGKPERTDSGSHQISPLRSFRPSPSPTSSMYATPCQDANDAKC